MGMEFRPYYFANEWVKMGHSVSIIGASFSHLRRRNPVVNKSFICEIIDGIKYYWIKTNNYKSNGLRRAYTMGQFILKLMFYSKKIVNVMDPDVVICSSTYPLDTYVGQRIKKISNKNVLIVHEVHDMWPLSPIEMGGMSPNNPFIKVMQKAEDSFCKNSDIVVSLLPAAREYFVEHGMDYSKYEVVMNGVALEDWEFPEELPKPLINHFLEVRESGKLSICFCGSIHKSYAIEPLIDAIGKIDNVYLTLIGPGLDKDELKKKSLKYKDRVKFFDPIPKRCIPKVFEYIDVSYVASLHYSIDRFGICMNKLFDSMMGGRPILYGVEAPNNYITEYDCGIFVDIEKEDSIIEGIKKIIALNEDERNCMGANGKNAVLKYYNYNMLAEKFINLLNKRLIWRKNEKKVIRKDI